MWDIKSQQFFNVVGAAGPIRPPALFHIFFGNHFYCGYRRFPNNRLYTIERRPLIAFDHADQPTTLLNQETAQTSFIALFPDIALKRLNLVQL